MHSLRTLVAPVFLFAFSSAALAGGGVHVVAPALGAGVDFTSIQDAVDAAGDGDLILVRSGDYAAFVIDAKALTVTADLGHDVNVNGATSVSGLAAEQTVILSNMVLYGSGVGHGLLLTANAGAVQVDGCAIQGAGTTAFIAGDGAYIIGCAAVTMTACVFSAASTLGGSAANSGISAIDSAVSLYECNVYGEQGFGPGIGGAGYRMNGGSLLVSGCSITGGLGGEGSVDPVFGICTDGGPGGSGLVMGTSGSPPVGGLLRRLDSTIVGGPGGPPPPGSTCVTGPPGQDIDLLAGTIQTIPVSHRTFSVTSPVRDGETATLHFEGLPGELVFLLVSFSQNPVYVPMFQGTWMPGSPYFLFWFGSIPAGGSLDLLYDVNVDPTFVSSVLCEQSLYYTIPSGWVLGSPRPCVILSSAF